jgi:hypothetical protein
MSGARIRPPRGREVLRITTESKNALRAGDSACFAGVCEEADARDARIALAALFDGDSLLPIEKSVASTTGTDAAGS